MFATLDHSYSSPTRATLRGDADARATGGLASSFIWGGGVLGLGLGLGLG